MKCDAIVGLHIVLEFDLITLLIYKLMIKRGHLQTRLIDQFISGLCQI